MWKTIKKLLIQTEVNSIGGLFFFVQVWKIILWYRSSWGKRMRKPGIEPGSNAWEASILPLYYLRLLLCLWSYVIFIEYICRKVFQFLFENVVPAYSTLTRSQPTSFIRSSLDILTTPFFNVCSYQDPSHYTTHMLTQKHIFVT